MVERTEEVQETADKLKNKKAIGPDYISLEITELVMKKVSKVFSDMFNELLRSSTFPSE